jgi:hypothetical protein
MSSPPSSSQHTLARKRRRPDDDDRLDQIGHHVPRQPAYNSSAKMSSERTQAPVRTARTPPSPSTNSPPSQSPNIQARLVCRRARVLVSSYCTLAEHIRESAAVTMLLDVHGPDSRGHHFVSAADILRPPSPFSASSLDKADIRLNEHTAAPSLRRLGLIEARADELVHG